MDEQTILNMPIFNSSGFLLLLFKFVLDLVAIVTISRFIYYPIRKSRGYLFAFCILNIIIFLVCNLLNNITLSLGFSFGIFAIFSILRFRTISIPIKEMTYLFIAVSLAIINALSNQTISITELLFTNLAIVGITYLLEKIWVCNELMKHIVYDNMEFIKPKNREQLNEDLRERTGLNIHRLEIGKIDFLKNHTEIRIYYYSTLGNGFVNDIDYSDDDDD